MVFDFYLFFVFIMTILAISASSYFIQCNDTCDIKDKNEDRRIISITNIVLSLFIFFLTCYFVYKRTQNQDIKNGHFMTFYLFSVSSVSVLSFVISAFLIDCYRTTNVNDRFALPSVNLAYTIGIIGYSIYLGVKGVE
jgi:uncharacterized BrkB/YihY/UPF0761 family membrane protein